MLFKHVLQCRLPFFDREKKTISYTILKSSGTFEKTIHHNITVDENKTRIYTGKKKKKKHSITAGIAPKRFDDSARTEIDTGETTTRRDRSVSREKH